MGGTLKTTIRLLIALAVSGTCLYFATRGTDWAGVSAVLLGARPHWILAVVVATLGAHVIRAQRWRILLRPVADVPYLPALSATVVGFGASMVLPLRLGEIVRPALLARRVGFALTPAVASIVIERLLDMFLVVGCFVGVTFLFPKLADYRLVACLLAAGAAAVLGLLFLAGRHRRRAEGVALWLLGLLPRRLHGMLHPILHGILDAARGLGDGPTFVLVLAFSAVLWIAIVLTYLFCFVALAMGVPLVTASLTTVVIVAAFVFLPQAPGFVGTWQAACVLALGLFFVDKDVAVGYSLLSWLIQLVVNVGAGAVAAAFQDVSVRQLRAATEADPAARRANVG